MPSPPADSVRRGIHSFAGNLVVLQAVTLSLPVPRCREVCKEREASFELARDAVEAPPASQRTRAGQEAGRGCGVHVRFNGNAGSCVCAAVYSYMCTTVTSVRIAQAVRAMSPASVPTLHLPHGQDGCSRALDACRDGIDRCLEHLAGVLQSQV